MDRPIDPATCVVIERCVGDRVRVIDVTGKINCTKASADELIRKERLTLVTRTELRSLAAKFVPLVSWEHLLRDPAGHDDSDVKAWKRVARLQERFRNDGDGWQWYCRFASVNRAGVCVEIMGMLIELTKRNWDERPNRMPIDYLNLLRQVMAETTTANVAVLRDKIVRNLTELEDDD